MSRVTELEKALTTLFRKGTEVGYTETEIDEFLENIDYHALLQAVWNKAETVYAYRNLFRSSNLQVRPAWGFSVLEGAGKGTVTCTPLSAAGSTTPNCL